jgi:hypothetical protein
MGPTLIMAKGDQKSWLFFRSQLFYAEKKALRF